MTGTPAERFAAKIDKGAGCWEWLGARSGAGYGQIRIAGRLVYAHRFSYEQHVGPIPPGKVIDHICLNKGCVNPRHLEVVTQAENMRRGGVHAWQSAKTHCPSGHEYTPSNTYTPPSKPRSRNCVTCRKARRHRA